MNEGKTIVVKVTNIRRVEGGALRAFVSVTIADKLTLHSVRVIQQEGKAPWVSLPQTEIKSTNGGKSKYFPIVEISDETLKQQITNAVLAAWTQSE